jgi:hypothetical protein
MGARLASPHPAHGHESLDVLLTARFWEIAGSHELLLRSHKLFNRAIDDFHIPGVIIKGPGVFLDHLQAQTNRIVNVCHCLIMSTTLSNAARNI